MRVCARLGAVDAELQGSGVGQALILDADLRVIQVADLKYCTSNGGVCKGGNKSNIRP